MQIAQKVENNTVFELSKKTPKAMGFSAKKNVSSSGSR
jgi:hypothetical protein